eukprot:CAMPEP_0182564744 /NCGR_PEP_ID=MMETSP1324-20130603/6628_1 /TAXON_ID=236786 /ORGANISM="Florenciella sp., Strain RCC1587" /LENGTH=58 /DNA_ID=CAMNT_0024778267 /DNA_START=17 /DNA_END=190 /DNA_ORIENTATION=+
MALEGEHFLVTNEPLTNARAHHFAGLRHPPVLIRSHRTVLPAATPGRTPLIEVRGKHL